LYKTRYETKLLEIMFYLIYEEETQKLYRNIANIT
jgi:hypothetical protein